MKASLKAGFTLIELMVVIAVLAIISTSFLILINPGLRIAQSKDAAAKSDIYTISKALDAYYVAQNQYPANLDVLVTYNELRSVPTQQSGNVACPAVSGAYTLVAPGTATAAGYYYCYYTVDGQSVVVMGSLYSVGANKWQCWDSPTGAKKTTSAAPTLTSGKLYCT